MDSLTVKQNNSFQNYNNGKTTHSFAPRPPIFFKLQQEILKLISVGVLLQENISFIWIYLACKKN